MIFVSIFGEVSDHTKESRFEASVSEVFFARDGGGIEGVVFGDVGFDAGFDLIFVFRVEEFDEVAEVRGVGMVEEFLTES